MTAARELAEGRCDVAICWDGGRSASFYNPPQLYAKRAQDIMLTNRWLQAFAM